MLQSANSKAKILNDSTRIITQMNIISYWFTWKNEINDGKKSERKKKKKKKKKNQVLCDGLL